MQGCRGSATKRAPRARGLGCSDGVPGVHAVKKYVRTRRVEKNNSRLLPRVIHPFIIIGQLEFSAQIRPQAPPKKCSQRVPEPGQVQPKILVKLGLTVALCIFLRLTV